MRLLYPSFLDKTPIIVNFKGDMDANGVEPVIFEHKGKCNFIGKLKQVYGKDGQAILLQAKATMKGDIAPHLIELKGEATILGVKYKIYTSNRVLNPDGSVNHTELELE